MERRKVKTIDQIKNKEWLDREFRRACIVFTLLAILAIDYSDLIKG